MATLPILNGYNKIEIKSTFPGVTSTSDTGIVQRVNFNGHYYSAQVTYPVMDRTQYRQIVGFLQAQQGALGSFEMSLDYYKDSSGCITTLTNRPADDTLKFNSAGLSNNTFTYTSDWTSTYYDYATHGDFLGVGDYLRFTNHDKLYQIVDFTNPDASGNGTIKVSPNFFTTPTLGEELKLTDVTMKVFQSSETMTIAAAQYGWAQIALNLREDI